MATYNSNSQSNIACVLEAGEEAGQKYWILRKKSSSTYKSKKKKIKSQKKIEILKPL
jgi:hypothetical protein